MSDPLHCPGWIFGLRASPPSAPQGKTTGTHIDHAYHSGTLPLAGPAMYAKLTPQWAGTLLGLLQLAMVPIPIIFYKYGARIRAKSPVIKKMREEQRKNEQRAARNQRRKAAAGSATTGPALVDEPIRTGMGQGEEKNGEMLGKA